MKSNIPLPQKTALYPADVRLSYPIVHGYGPLRPIVRSNGYYLFARELVGAMSLSSASRSMLDHIRKISLSSILTKVVFFIVGAISVSVANIKGFVALAVKCLKNKILHGNTNLHAFTAKIDLHVSVFAGSLGFNLPFTNIDPAIDVVYFPIKGSNSAKRRYLVNSLVSGYISPLFHAFLPSNSVGINHRFITL